MESGEEGGFEFFPKVKEDALLCLSFIAKSLDSVERVGEDKDEPEGVRVVRLSDTLAGCISDQIRVCVGILQ